MKIHEYQARELLSASGVQFLPAKVARSADEVVAAFEECFGKKPYECYFDFDIAKPLKSG